MLDAGAIGLRVRVATNDAGVLALARAAFGRFARPAGAADLVIDALVGAGAEAEGAAVGDGGATAQAGRVGGAGAAAGDGDVRRSARETTPPAPRLFHRERGALYTAGDAAGSVVVADLATGRAAAFIQPDTPPAVVRTVLLESPIWRMAAWRGRVAIHAAAVVVNGTTFVLRGAGGAGKSTLAALAARAGHAVVAEEVAWVDPTGTAPVVRGAPWVIHLDPAAAAEWLPGLDVAGRAAAPRAAGEPKRALDVAVDLGGRCVELAPLGPLVFLERSAAGGAAVDRLAREDAHARFRATAVAGETTQRAAALAAACDDLVARGAFALRSASPGAALAALEALARRAAAGGD